jgi:Ner family transcriptional regulator
MSNGTANNQRNRRLGKTAQTASPTGGWHPEQIKAAIRMLGLNLADLSRQHGYASDAVRRVIKRGGSAPLERIIADVIGQEPKTLWPDRYDHEGHPIDRRLLHMRHAVRRPSLPPTPKARRRAA